MIPFEWLEETTLGRGVINVKGIFAPVSVKNHCFQNRTEPGGRTVKTGNQDENRFFKPKEPDFLLIP